MKSFLTPPGRVVFGVALSAAIFLGCARSARLGPTFGIAAVDRSVQVTIQNDDFKDATIYANWSGNARKRLGMVTGKTSQTFTIAWHSDSVQFDVDFIAGGTISYEPIDVWEGDHLELFIMNFADEDQGPTNSRPQRLHGLRSAP